MKQVVPAIVAHFRSVRFTITSDDWTFDDEGLTVAGNRLEIAPVAFGSAPGTGVWVIASYIHHVINGEPDADPFMHVLNLWEELGHVASPEYVAHEDAEEDA